ncbi:hypothetical protein FIBSPDRAFT_953588 [Athelia psychrophila]|uniref:Uncharacterized protein n=1 Tax=Athelia psychrophila TaxID=1759441 RepID=A0A166K653_9AGAM|nr:hypothetical protein FIBSPDRAFT_953588 [Fibularhizoctonia sp. CBS 109695]
MAQDDEAAEVERVGKGRLSLGGQGGAIYETLETLWGCCGRSVGGDGDMGPPDGQCYGGKHTMNTKRARFRADSTPHEDRLTHCTRHCPRRAVTGLNAPIGPPSAILRVWLRAFYTIARAQSTQTHTLNGTDTRRARVF